MPYKTLIVKDFDKEEFEWTTSISDEDIAFVVDEGSKTIFTWHGSRASRMKKYKAGTLATKIKSLYQFYGFKTVVVSQGEETGDLREEIDKLLKGEGTPLSEEELELLKPLEMKHAPPSIPAPRPPPAAEVRDAGAIPDQEKEPAGAVPPVDDLQSRIKELEEEIEKEKKKALHRVTKVREELEEQKLAYEQRIKELEEKIGEIADIKEIEKQYEEKISNLKKENEEAIAKLKKEQEDKIATIKNEYEEKIKEAIEKAPKGIPEEEVEEKIAETKKAFESRLEAVQAELSLLRDQNKNLKEKLEQAEKDTIPKEELENLKEENARLANELEKVEKERESLKKELEEVRCTTKQTENLVQLQKKLEEEIERIKKNASKDQEELKQRYQETISKLENEILTLKRKLADAEEAIKEAGKKKEATSIEDTTGKTTASGTGKEDEAGLVFVNPYSSGETDLESDPLLDLKSFLNTVDPSKPINPELRTLLEGITKKIEDDEEIIKDLKLVKKKTKDKELVNLVDEIIDKIKRKRA